VPRTFLLDLSRVYVGFGTLTAPLPPSLTRLPFRISCQSALFGLHNLLVRYNRRGEVAIGQRLVLLLHCLLPLYQWYLVRCSTSSRVTKKVIWYRSFPDNNYWFALSLGLTQTVFALRLPPRKLPFWDFSIIASRQRF